MKIFLTTPALNPPHGGIRVLLEWANHLSKWHHVYLYTQKPGKCRWKTIAPKVMIVSDTEHLRKCDCLIIGSPHAIHLQDHPYCPKKVFIFMQMMEHMFRPNDLPWVKQCEKFYTTPHPIIAISQWNIDRLKSDYGRTGETHLVGNGVNLDDFPINPVPKDGKTILVEGWEGYNPCKDVEAIGPKVAARLKAEGYRILAYGQTPIKTMPDACDEYHLLPNLATINQLYERATILIKASKYDARSCSPMEAMTKGAVTARAIIEGDDDLIHLGNSIRCEYEVDELFASVKMLLLNPLLRDDIAKQCIEYVQTYTWDYWMNRINEILCS